MKASGIFSKTFVEVIPYTPLLFDARSPDKPCKYTPKDADSKEFNWECADSPLIIPVNKSPDPAFESPLFDQGLILNSPLG